MKFQLSQLAEILKLQRPRKNFKAHEKGRLNPTAIQMEHLEGLQKNIPYIWAIDNVGNIIIGIEKPWLYPHAFGLNDNDHIWGKISNQLKLENDNFNYGHPTLTPIYGENGEIISSDISELAFIGGELVYKDNTWLINNKSGRFRHVLNKDNEPASPKIIMQILTLVSEELRRLGIVDEIEIVFYSKPKTNGIIVNGENENLIVSALLEYLNQHKPSQLLKLTTFENKDYAIVNEALIRLQNGKDKNLAETMEFLAQKNSGKEFSSKLNNLLNKLQSLQTESTAPKFHNT